MESLLRRQAYDQLTALSWPNGATAFGRVMFLSGVVLLRFIRACFAPAVDLFAYTLVFCLFLFCLAEALFAWLCIVRQGRFWTKTLLFYPVHMGLMLFNALSCAFVAADYQQHLWSNWTSLLVTLVYCEMICSIGVVVCCLVHLLSADTFPLAQLEFRLCAENVSMAVRTHLELRRDGYENIEESV